MEVVSCEHGNLKLIKLLIIVNCILTEINNNNQMLFFSTLIIFVSVEVLIKNFCFVN